MRIRHAVLLSISLAAVLAFASCHGAPKPAPEGVSPQELIQRAQEATDVNNYEQALILYQAVIDRFPEDIVNTCAAEYEIAFIHFKQKNTDLAVELFAKLLERYNQPDAQLLPAKYKVLTEMILVEIEENKETKKE